MDFSKGKGSFLQKHEHTAHILSYASDDGAIKTFKDETGHAERTEVSLPEGKVIIVKDYENVPTLAHYKKVIVTSSNDDPLGEISIFPEDRMGTSRLVRFFDGTSQIGRGTGNVGMAIAHQLLHMADDPREGASVDPEIISSIKALFRGK